MIDLAGHDPMLLLLTYGYWAVLVIVGLESLGVPMPGETTLVVAAIYAGASHRLSIVLVVLAAIAGAILGDNIGYAIGHCGGCRLLVRYGRYIRLHEARVKLARYLFPRQGGKVVFFGRFVSVLRTYAGTTRMPWWRFLAFNVTGGILWALVYGVGGYLLGTQLARISRPVGVVAGIAAAVVIVAFLVFLARNAKRLEEEAERAFTGPSTCLESSSRKGAVTALSLLSLIGAYGLDMRPDGRSGLGRRFGETQLDHHRKLIEEVVMSHDPPLSIEVEDLDPSRREPPPARRHRSEWPVVRPVHLQDAHHDVAGVDSLDQADLGVRRGGDPFLHPGSDLLLRSEGDAPGMVGHRESVRVAAHLGVQITPVERLYLGQGSPRVIRGHSCLLMLPIRLCR